MVNVRSILDDHEASIVERIAVLRAELVPLEKELLDVRLAKAALSKGSLTNQAELSFSQLSSPETASSHIDTWRQRILNAASAAPKSPYSHLTIKELVKKALHEYFERGATANQLLDLFANAWGRTDVVRTSLSPQLSRLRHEGEVFREGQVWRLRIPRPGPPPANEKTAANQ